MAKPITLKFNGKAFSPVSPLKKVIQYLDSCPHDEIFDHYEVSERLGLPRRYIGDRYIKGGLERHAAKAGGRLYVGHPKAIAELRRQMEER